MIATETPEPAAVTDSTPATATQPPAAAGPAVDSIGREFDPTKFRSDASGAPKLDAIGRFVPQRLGRKKRPGGPAAPAAAPGDTPAAALSFDDVEAAVAAPEVAPAAGDQGETGAPANQTAETVIGIIQTALILIGDEEGILTEAEKLLLRQPLERVLRKYDVGADVMPAEVDLVMALAGLVIARLTKPKTSTWFAKAKAWCVNFIFRRRGSQIARAVTRETVAQ